LGTFKNKGSVRSPTNVNEIWEYIEETLKVLDKVIERYRKIVNSARRRFQLLVSAEHVHFDKIVRK